MLKANLRSSHQGIALRRSEGFIGSDQARARGEQGRKAARVASTEETTDQHSIS